MALTCINIYRSMVPRWGNLWEQVNVVNFEVLSSKIVGIQELGVAFSLIFIIYLKSPYGESDQCTILQQEARET